jgi:hypothetical protein
LVERLFLLWLSRQRNPQHLKPRQSDSCTMSAKARVLAREQELEPNRIRVIAGGAGQPT